MKCDWFDLYDFNSLLFSYLYMVWLIINNMYILKGKSTITF